MFNVAFFIKLELIVILYFASSSSCLGNSAMKIEKAVLDSYAPNTDEVYNFLPADVLYAEKKGFDDGSMHGVLRFGKRNFVRFDRSFDNDLVIKKEMPGVLRFGKRGFGLKGMADYKDKKDGPGILRFGKRFESVPGVLRFGKRDIDSMSGVLRFGKRDYDSMPGVLRFGKRDFDGSMPGVLRFGKRDVSGLLRFGRSDIENMPGVSLLQFNKLNGNNIPGVFRFGKRNDDTAVLSKKSDMPGVLRFG